MMATELVKQLHELILVHGNLDVRVIETLNDFEGEISLVEIKPTERYGSYIVLVSEEW